MLQYKADLWTLSLLLLEQGTGVKVRAPLPSPPAYTCLMRAGPSGSSELKGIIIHSKYFPDSDWLKAHV